NEQFLLLLKESLPAITLEVLIEASTLFAHDSDALLLMIESPEADDLLIKDIIKKTIFSPSMLQKILANELLNKKNSLLQLMVQQAFKALELNLFQKKQWDECLILAIEHSLTLEHTPAEIKAVLKQNANLISPQLGLAVLRVYGEQMQPYLNLETVIDSAKPVDLAMLNKLKDLSATELIHLAKKQFDSHQINNLLNRSDMTPNIANILFKNQAYDGQLHNWNWLTEKQILSVINKIAEFNDVRAALMHPLISKEGRAQWLNEREIKQKQQQVKPSTPAHIKLEFTLEALKTKAFSHLIKSLSDNNYVDAAKTAFTLFKQLDTEKNDYFNNKNCNVDQFAARCALHIDKATPILEMHRGYKQLLLDILNVVLNCLTLGINKCVTGHWRFFTANTDSINIVNKITRRIAERDGKNGEEDTNLPH
ncbi:MAG: hypothetical protein PSV35_07595, partial [bacterium]|nr:hypothetical protein [bacterium]